MGPRRCARLIQVIAARAAADTLRRRSSMDGPMKKIPKATYQTPAELEARIKAREADAARVPSGEARQSILKEIAQLRAYADIKRWLATPPNGK